MTPFSIDEWEMLTHGQKLSFGRMGLAPSRSDRGKSRYRHRQAITDAIKLTAGCVDCGYDVDARALDFDHRDTKNFGIAARHAAPLAKVFEEIMLCDVRCANCHRIKTWR